KKGGCPKRTGSSSKPTPWPIRDSSGRALCTSRSKAYQSHHTASEGLAHRWWRRCRASLAGEILIEIPGQKLGFASKARFQSDAIRPAHPFLLVRPCLHHGLREGLQRDVACEKLRQDRPQ